MKKEDKIGIVFCIILGLIVWALTMPGHKYTPQRRTGSGEGFVFKWEKK